MTTLAWDGKMLAGDSQATTSAMRRLVESKVFRVTKPDGEVVLFGSSGRDQDLHIVLKWIREGMREADRPKLEPDSFSGFYITKEGNFRFESGLIPLLVIEPFHAIGNGRDFAMAAMHCGKTAREAVGIAALFDIYTGGPITSVTLNEEAT